MRVREANYFPSSKAVMDFFFFIFRCGRAHKDYSNVNKCKNVKRRSKTHCEAGRVRNGDLSGKSLRPM